MHTLMEFIAIAAALLASLTGIAAVGCNGAFSYSRQELRELTPPALVYTWIACSTAASGLTAVALFDAAARGVGPSAVSTLAASTAGSLLLALAHVALKRWVRLHRDGASK